MKTFLARQPLLDLKNVVIGYELLFRTSQSNEASVVDGYSATLKVMKDLLLNFGVKQIANGKRFFINFNDDLILQNAPELFKPEELVIELLEDTLGNLDVVEALKSYREKGYLIALDDFEFDSSKIELVKNADIIKLDFLLTSREDLRNMVKELKKYNVILLAEKVETMDEYEFAKELGCTMFQGYYFQRPVVLESSEMNSIPTVYYELLEELNKAEVDFSAIAKIMKKDTGLTVSILKLLNSAAYYSKNKIKSLERALVRLGTNESKSVIMMNMLKTVASDAVPNAILNTSLRRGKQAELLAKHFNLNDRSEELFILGLLSLINIIMRRSMTDILSDVPLEKDIISALLGDINDLSRILDILVLHEMDRLDEVTELLNKHNVDIDLFSTIYIEATSWADSIW